MIHHKANYPWLAWPDSDGEYDEVAEGLLAMLDWRESKGFASTLVSLLAIASPKVFPASPDERRDHFRTWADALFSVESRIKDVHPERVDFERTECPNCGE